MQDVILEAINLLSHATEPLEPEYIAQFIFDELVKAGWALESYRFYKAE